MTRNSSPANVIHPPPMPIRGRVLALVGIVLVALNLRLAITSLSVLYDALGKDVTGFSVTLIGILPLICFSLFGLLSHNVAERFGFENSLLIAMLAVFVGTVLRAFSSEIWTFAACTVVAGAGMAFGNVLLFPVIKKYFPDHIGVMTATFSVLLAVSSAVPPSLAIPVADAVHWRVSIGWWGIVALAAALPWIAIRPDKDLRDYEKAHKESKLGAGAGHPEASTHVPVWKWPIAWSLMSLFGFGFLSRFSITTHLESYLDPVSGHHYFSAAEVGSMLSVYNSLGLFHALIIPLVIGRMKHPYIIIALSGILQIIGYLGLLYEPTLSWAWAVVLAPSWMVCTALFQLINLRTHTTTGASALSGFVQGVGYIFAGIGPLFVGVLHEWSGGWSVPFWFLIVAAAVMMVVGAPSVKHEYLEDAVAVRVKHPSDSAAVDPQR